MSVVSLARGISFDIAGSGVPKRIACKRPRSDDGWLVLDRNENGWIDDGTELFGTATLQPNPPEGHLKNGFLALAVFDTGEEGGNANGFLDRGDAVFERLRIWQDRNHNRVSEASELVSLRDADVGQIDLQYKISKRVDERPSTV